MNQDTIIRLTGNFDLLGKNIPDFNITFWFAREIQSPLGYVRWENFLTAIKRAMTACESAGFSVNDHFRGVTKMVDLGSGSKRPIDDFMLTRYACYLVAMNGDPRKEEIAFAQSYFAFLFGKQTLAMKDQYGITGSAPFADFLPTLTIAAKNLATEMTNFNVARDDMHGERNITHEHVANNASGMKSVWLNPKNCRKTKTTNKDLSI